MLLMLLLLLAPRRSTPVVPAVPEPVPTSEERCLDASERPAPARRSITPAEDFPDDSGGPLVLVDNRGWLRVEAWRDDGTPETDAEIGLVNCDEPRAVEEGGLWRVHAGPCTIVAWRNDGLYETPRQLARVEIVPHEELTVEFTFPADRTGGLGIVVEETEFGIEVLEVIPGTPADDAGIVPGDVILALDGEDVTGLYAWEVADAMRGLEETPVLIELQGDTGGVPMSLTRAFIDVP